jgi:glutamate synthase (NADPH/NADH) large chain
MSGGIAYVLDEDDTFKSRCNMAMVELEPVPEEGQVAEQEFGHYNDLEAHGRVDVMADLTSKDAERLRTPSSEDSDQWVFVIDQRHRAPHGKTDMLNG